MHYLCLVVGRDVDGALEPFGEAGPSATPKYDGYTVGGAFDGHLTLKVPRRAKGWRRLLAWRPTRRGNSARKGDVVEEALVSNPPSALLCDGEWTEAPIFFASADDERMWRDGFARRLAQIPEDSWITVVDLHV